MDALLAVAVQGGQPAIIAFVVLSLVRGWLIPRSAHLDRISDYQATIVAKDKTIAELHVQRDILLGKSREPIG